MAIDSAIEDLRRLIHDLHGDVERRASLPEEVDALVRALERVREVFA